MLNLSKKSETKMEAFIDSMVEQSSLHKMMDSLPFEQGTKVAGLLKLLIMHSFNSRIDVSKQDVMEQLCLKQQGFDEILTSCQVIKQATSNDGLAVDSLPSISFDVEQESFYLTRYWQIRKRLFAFLKSKPENDAPSSKELTNWPEDIKQAWSICQQKGWLVIQGAAGTGKSTLALSLLNQLFIQNPKPISLVALTGKATSRLSDSINNDPSLTALQNPLVQCSTIHRLLEKKLGSKTQFNQLNYLPQAIILIDEVSMLTWDLLDELICSIQPQTIIIFLGDANQLQSIGVGGFLKELIQHFPDNSLLLTQQRRFTQQSEIHNLACLALKGEIFSTPLPAPHCLNADINKQNSMLKDWCQKKLLNPIKKIAHLPKQKIINQSFTDNSLFNELLQVVVLSPKRFSNHGIYAMNKAIQQFLYQQGALAKAYELCVGVPVVFRKNLPYQKVFNGDRGVVVSTTDGVLQVLFSGHDRPLVVAEQNVDVAFSMTIHQTQGSEFDSVLLWFGEMDSLSRQWFTPNLLYTAITRAKKELLICGNIPND